MNKQWIITHYYHSGFSVACEDVLVIFDYWRGEEGELTPELQIRPGDLKAYRSVFVFISHEHIDHLDPVVFTWKDLGNVTYIVSSDMPVGTRGKRMAPGDRLELADGVTVTAFDSTDLGVSFLVNLKGVNFFHAGDLNFWHWREESTMPEIEEAEAEFRKAVKPIAQEAIDVAFFPVDPRQGAMYEAGANYFILSVKPRLLIPMHYFHRVDVAMEYARTASCRSTEVLAMPGYGDAVILETDAEGYFNISFPEVPEEEAETPPEPEPDAGPDLVDLMENNPFDESDLPLAQLAQLAGGEEPDAPEEPPVKNPENLSVPEPPEGP